MSKAEVLHYKNGDMNDKTLLDLIDLKKANVFEPPLPGAHFDDRQLFFKLLSELDSKRAQDDCNDEGI